MLESGGQDGESDWKQRKEAEKVQKMKREQWEASSYCESTDPLCFIPQDCIPRAPGYPTSKEEVDEERRWKKKNTVCSMCEVHALDTACMCVKLWAHVMSWNRSVHTGLWDHMKLWVLLTRESCLGGIQCCMSISQTEWPLSSQKTIVSLHPYRLAPEGKTEQTWACTFKDRRWSNSPLISQGSWDCYILLGWLLKSQKLNARDWLSPTDVTVEKKEKKNPHASSLRRVATEMSLDPLRSDAEWLDEAKTVDCILFISPSLLRPGGTLGHGAGCLSAPVVYFTCDDGVGWGLKRWISRTRNGRY